MARGRMQTDSHVSVCARGEEHGVGGGFDGPLKFEVPSRALLKLNFWLGLSNSILTVQIETMLELL